MLLGVGLFVRLKLFETPEFERIRDSYHVTKLPIGEVVRKYWWNVLLGWLARMGEGGVFTVYTLYMLPYLTGIMHLPRTLVLSSVTAAALVLIFTVPLASAWSDRVGRRRLFGISTLVNGLACFPLLWMLQIRQSRTGRRCDRDCHRHAVGAGLWTRGGVVLRVVRHARALYRRVAGLSVRGDHLPGACADHRHAAGRLERQPALVSGVYLLLGCIVSAIATGLMRRTFT